MTGINKAQRKGERGITIVLVAFSLLALLGMAALAIDVSTLYMAHGEAQRAADAAALAGARMIASSGYTSTPSTLAAADVCQTSAAPGANAAANRQAEAVAAENLVAGQPATVQAITCLFGAAPANPQISVTVQRTALPTFFGRIWGGTANSVSATAVAEAYNPSGSTAPVQVQGVKPWLVANCDTTIAPNTNCNPGAAPYFINPADGSIANNGAFIGKKIQLRRGAAPNPVALQSWVYYFALDVPTSPAASCPSGASPSCGPVGGGDDYFDNIACAQPSLFSCQAATMVGPAEAIKVLNVGGLGNRTREGARCLIHANNDDLLQGQDRLLESGGGAPPAVITGGDNNPNLALQNIQNISRSDSVVTVPLYDGANLCPGGCSVTRPIVGFLQLGIQRTIPPGGGQPQLEAVILNASGCNPGAAGTPVSGGGVSPIPVRLIHQ